jgi:type IV pilus assembly protein PilA
MRVTVTGQGLGATDAEGTVALRGTIQADGSILWACGGTLNAKYRPASCRDFND